MISDSIEGIDKAIDTAYNAACDSKMDMAIIQDIQTKFFHVIPLIELGSKDLSVWRSTAHWSWNLCFIYDCDGDLAYTYAPGNECTEKSFRVPVVENIEQAIKLFGKDHINNMINRNDPGEAGQARPQDQE